MRKLLPVVFHHKNEDIVLRIIICICSKWRFWFVALLSVLNCCKADLPSNRLNSMPCRSICRSWIRSPQPMPCSIRYGVTESRPRTGVDGSCLPRRSRSAPIRNAALSWFYEFDCPYYLPNDPAEEPPSLAVGVLVIAFTTPLICIRTASKPDAALSTRCCGR